MKLLMASDIHGSSKYCRELLKAVERENPDKILLLGDLLYHGPRNDLPMEYDAKEVAKMLNGIKEKLLCVRGNCDSEVDQMMLDFPILADFCLVEWEGHTIYATHGHHHSDTNPPPIGMGDILLCGHTHIPACKDINGLLYLNPGSVSIPKADSWHGYMVLEGGELVWKDLEGNVKKKQEI